jgi:hypothetical protein
MTKAVGNPKKRRVAAWEGIGILFLIAAGFVLHFLYEWTGRSGLVAWLAPVNESVWEHLKLGFWSLTLYSLVEYWFIKDSVKNFIAAKAAGILALQLFVLGVFYAYTSVTHTEIPMVDIAAYIIGSFICQIVGYLILTSGKLPTAVTILSVIFLLAHAVLLVVFTFAPPEGHMFKESSAPLMGNLSKDTGFTFRCC